MRLKLVCILGAILFLFMYMCSCVSKVEAQNTNSEFDVRMVHHSMIMNIYQVTTPNGTVYVARSGHGLCTLN